MYIYGEREGHRVIELFFVRSSYPSFYNHGSLQWVLPIVIPFKQRPVETDFVPAQQRWEDPFVSFSVFNIASVEVPTYEFAFRPRTMGHVVLAAVARDLNLSKLQKSKLVLLRKDVPLKSQMTLRHWCRDHFVFEAKGATVSLKRPFFTEPWLRKEGYMTGNW